MASRKMPFEKGGSLSILATSTGMGKCTHQMCAHPHYSVMQRFPYCSPRQFEWSPKFEVNQIEAASLGRAERSTAWWETDKCGSSRAQTEYRKLRILALETPTSPRS